MENPLPGDEDQQKIQWTKQYLLGMISEINEVLQQIDWKLHTKQDILVSSRNMEGEVVDLLKYTLSLAELWGIPAKDLLYATQDKTEEMSIKRDMEKWTPTRNILLVDMDGTLADWRKTFLNWIAGYGVLFNEDSEFSLSLETDIGISYDSYKDWKYKFESIGMYRYLEPIVESINYVRKQARDRDIVVFTARPAKTLKRIWWDSYLWLEEQAIVPKLLKIGAEERIEYALSMRSKGFEVTLFEDNPELAIRAANSEIPVILCDRPYNKFLAHELIHRGVPK